MARPEQSDTTQEPKDRGFGSRVDGRQPPIFEVVPSGDRPGQTDRGGLEVVPSQRVLPPRLGVTEVPRRHGDDVPATPPDQLQALLVNSVTALGRRPHEREETQRILHACTVHADALPKSADAGAELFRRWAVYADTLPTPRQRRDVLAQAAQIFHSPDIGKKGPTSDEGSKGRDWVRGAVVEAYNRVKVWRFEDIAKGFGVSRRYVLAALKEAEDRGEVVERRLASRHEYAAVLDRPTVDVDSIDTFTLLREEVAAHEKEIAELEAFRASADLAPEDSAEVQKSIAALQGDIVYRSIVERYQEEKERVLTSLRGERNGRIVTLAGDRNVTLKEIASEVGDIGLKRVWDIVNLATQAGLIDRSAPPVLDSDREAVGAYRQIREQRVQEGTRLRPTPDETTALLHAVRTLMADERGATRFRTEEIAGILEVAPYVVSNAITRYQLRGEAD